MSLRRRNILEDFEKVSNKTNSRSIRSSNICSITQWDSKTVDTVMLFTFVVQIFVVSLNGTVKLLTQSCCLHS